METAGKKIEDEELRLAMKDAGLGTPATRAAIIETLLKREYITREKKLTNMRTTASDEMIRLETPREVTLELALEYIDEDELIEVTPAAVRLRKRALDANERKKAARAARAVEPS